VTTIHEETMRELCAGADWQQTYAHNARNRADELGQLIDPAEKRLADLRREATEVERELAKLRGELADVQKARDKHARLAADFLALATRECEANGWDMPAPAAPQQPRTGEQIIRKAVDDLTEPAAARPNSISSTGRLPGLSRACLLDDCATDRAACDRVALDGGGDCAHGCHGVPPADALSGPPAAEHIQPDPAPEPKAETRARSPWALLLGLYVRMMLAGRQSGHAGRRRPLKHRALVEVA